MRPVRGLPTRTCWIQSMSWLAMVIPSTWHAPMGSSKYYGGRKAGSLRLPSQSGWTPIIVLVSFKMHVGQCLRKVVPCGAMTAAWGRSLWSATLVLSSKCTSKHSFVTWYALTCKLPCIDPWTPCTYRSRGCKMIKWWWRSLFRMESLATRVPPTHVLRNLRTGKPH